MNRKAWVGLAVGMGWLGMAPAGSGELAEALFAEGQWALARIECARRLAVPPPAVAEAHRLRLMAAECSWRLAEGDRRTALDELAALWRDPSVERETRCRAAYAFGQAWNEADTRQAVAALAFVFNQTRDVPLFWRAGCALSQRFRREHRLRREQAWLWRSLQTCRSAWPRDVVAECQGGSGTGRVSWGARPARWLVGFYRRQISPAIGARCSLQPSCSAYLLEACQAHGLLGFALLGDRLIREPGVYAAGAKPVVMPDGRIRYADPLSDHDAWMGDD